MKIFYDWCSYFDKELNGVFIITPNGQFVEIENTKKTRYFKKIITKSLGLNPKSEIDFEYCQPTIQDLIITEDNCSDVPFSPIKIPPFYNIEEHDLIKSLTKCTLYYLSILNQKYGDITADNKIELSKYIRHCKKHLSTIHNKDCLYTSINQFGLLSASGYKPYMYVGGFIPVRKMHAWVELDSKLYFDDLEEIKHFYPLIRFQWDRS